MELLWRERPTLGNDRRAILSVEVHAFEGAIVLGRVPHVGPVEMTGFGIHHNPIRDWTHSSYDDLPIRTVRFHREDATTACIQKIQETTRGFVARRGTFCFGNSGFRHKFSFGLLIQVRPLALA